MQRLEVSGAVRPKRLNRLTDRGGCRLGMPAFVGVSGDSFGTQDSG
jgi:hypothetical protein